MKKKILLSILCICMVLTMMPTLAFAEVVAETPSIKGVKPEFKNTTIYVKTKEATEAIFTVKNAGDYNAEGTWKVYDHTKKNIKKDVAATYTTEGVLTLSGSNIMYFNYITYTPKDGQESTQSLCDVEFGNAAKKPCMNKYIIAWGPSIPWKIEISENSQTFGKVTYQVGGPSEKTKDAQPVTDYKVTRNPKTNIATFEFTNEFMKTQLGDAKEKTIFFDFKYTGGSGYGAIKPNITLIDKVKESTTDPNESKWKKGSKDSLSFQVNDCYNEKGSFIEGEPMIVNNQVISGITRSFTWGPQSYITVKLAPEYLEKLNCGWHRMEFFFGETEEQEAGPLSLRLLSDGKSVSSVELVPIDKYLRHVIGDFLIYDDKQTIESLPKEPPVYVAPKREPTTPDPKPTDPSTNPPVVYPPIVYPPVVTPVVPDTPVVPVPPVVEPVEPAKPETPVEPAKPDTPVDGDESSTTNLKTDNEKNKSNSPQTGDNTNPWTWMILFGMSGIGLGSILINKKRNTNI